MKSMFVAVAAVAAFGLIGPVSGNAQSRSSYYSVTPATASPKSSVVTRDIIWKCADGVCGAAKANARDAIVCELAAREFGVVTAFRANGVDFDTDALTKCNTKAR